MIQRILSTPLPKTSARIPPGQPQRVAPDVLAGVLPGPGRDRLAAGAVLAVTSGQQPGLFTGPLYTVYKALSAIALARRLERERNVPVVPVFWVAGDDHDFAEANHCWVLGRDGEPVRIVLRERPSEAPQLPLFREICGTDALRAVDTLSHALPESEFKGEVVNWLQSAYRPEQNLADAGAEALNQLLAPRGLAVFRAHDATAKRGAAPWLLKGLDVALTDGLTPVLVEGRLGRDRLRADGKDFVTRRSGERFSRAQLERLASEQPECLSPNVLLRPVVEAALFPTVAYLAGPGEMEYLPEAAPLFQQLGVAAPPPLPRWSGLIIEARIEKVLEKHGLTPEDLLAPPGVLEARIVRAGLPPELTRALTELRAEIEGRYGTIGGAIAALDPTLERTAQSARNAALAGTHDLEKRIVASLKRSDETLVGQIARARAALAPGGQPQERVLTVATFLARYGRGVLDEIDAEV